MNARRSWLGRRPLLVAVALLPTLITAVRADDAELFLSDPDASTARANGSMPTPRLYCLVSGSTRTSCSAMSARRMCSVVLGTSPSACAIAFRPSGVRLRLSRRRIAIARVTAGTARMRGPGRSGMIVYIQD